MASINSNVILIAVLGFFICYLSLTGASTYAEQERDSSVVVVGKVFCDTCLENRLSGNGYFVSGASIAVECALNRKTMTLSMIGETDENGEFRVELPSSILQSADQLNKCWVTPRNSPLVSCNIPSTAAPSKLTLQSASNGVVTYSAGLFSYRHETVPPSCYSKDLLAMIRGREMAEKADESSKAGQQTPTIPSLPKLPPTSLPSVPPFPKLATPPLPSVPPLPKAPPLPSIPPTSLPSVPPFPKLATPPLPSVPPLPKTPPLPSIPPTSLPSVPPFPKLATPPLPSVPPLPKAPPLPSIPPLPSVPPLPKAPPLPSIPPLPNAPPLPTIPPLPSFNFPPFPKPTIPGSPPFPNFQVPPFPFLTPPPPGH
eukprot:PITA_01290